jgi:Polyketide cyclase / dehydrase and lipid transport
VTGEERGRPSRGPEGRGYARAVRLPTFSCQPVDEQFFDHAPVVLRESFDVPRPAEEVWAELVAEQPLSWCRILDGVAWTSPRPFGVGTTRTVRSLRGANVLHERFFRWEEGRRKSFHAERASAPLFRRFAEDYLVEPTGDSAARMTWTIAFEPQPLARLTAPVNRRILGTLFSDTRIHYAGGR